MKALKILQEISTEWCNSDANIQIDEAIKELEDLQNRKCENCKHNKEQDDFMIYCEKEMCPDGSKLMWHSFTKDFCCKYWESK